MKRNPDDDLLSDWSESSTLAYIGPAEKRNACFVYAERKPRTYPNWNATHWWIKPKRAALPPENLLLVGTKTPPSEASSGCKGAALRGPSNGPMEYNSTPCARVPDPSQVNPLEPLKDLNKTKMTEKAENIGNVQRATFRWWQLAADSEELCFTDISSGSCFKEREIAADESEPSYMQIWDEDGTLYKTVTWEKPNGAGCDTWIVGHTNEPFQVTPVTNVASFGDGEISYAILAGNRKIRIWSTCIRYNTALTLEAREILTPELVKEHQIFFPARSYKKTARERCQREGSKWELIKRPRGKSDGGMPNTRLRIESTRACPYGSNNRPARKSLTSSGSKNPGGTACLGLGTRLATTPSAEPRSRPSRRILKSRGNRICPTHRSSTSSGSKLSRGTASQGNGARPTSTSNNHITPTSSQI